MNKVPVIPLCAGDGHASPNHADGFFLRPTREQARLEGIKAGGFNDDDYAVVLAADGYTRIGRIYREIIHAKLVWRWTLQVNTKLPPTQGLSGSLEEARHDFWRRYRETPGRR